MKTTIDIPDALYKKAKIRAVENGGSLKDLMISALESQLAGDRVAEPRAPYFARRKLRPGFKALMDRGALRPRPGDRDVTDIISEERDHEVQ